MASTAISAQGTIVQISTSTAAPATISACTIGNPAIVTATSHGFVNGDRITIASVVGTMATSINTVWTVMYKTTNTFAIALDTTGMTYTSGGTATGSTYTAIANVKTVSDVESGSVSEIDVTNLASVAKEKRLGLVDNGSFSLACHHSNADPGQAAAQARRLDGVQANFKIILPTGTTPTASFAGFVKKFGKSLGVDGVVESTIEVTISGAITWA